MTKPGQEVEVRDTCVTHTLGCCQPPFHLEKEMVERLGSRQEAELVE